MKRLQALYLKHSSPLARADVFSENQLRKIALCPPMIEVKHRIGKTSQTFSLEDWSTMKRSCVGRWVSGEADAVYGSPAGSYSWGVWVKGGVLKNIGAYRMHDRHGNLLAYRLDILKDVVIRQAGSSSGNSIESSAESRVEFTDLVVDCWLWPDQQGQVLARDITVEDEEELRRLRAGGLLSHEDAALVQDTLRRVLRDPGPQLVAAAVDEAIAQAVQVQGAQSLVRP